MRGSAITVMIQVAELRKQAEVLRASASKEENAIVKASLLKLADQCEALANERERFLELQEKIRTSNVAGRGD